MASRSWSVNTRQKLLLLISDGKPTDYDRYEGRYGIADVRQAMREAHQARIHTYALAVDVQAKHYLPQMFGSGNFQILPHPASGPGPHGHVSPAVALREDRMPEAFNKARFPLMFLGLLALLTALWGGLLRLGWALPLPPHLVGGARTVDGLWLSRHVDRRRAGRCPGGLLALCRPALHCSGALCLLAGWPAPPLFMLLGSLGLVAIFAVIVRQQLAMAT